MFAKHYAKLYDLFNSQKDYKKEIRFVHKWAGYPHSIFDIGPGTGSYWKFFPKNVKLFGVENSPYMIEQAKEPRIVRGDITTYRHKNGKFDCITALFDVLNYIPKHDWWKKLPLRQGGHFIFDVWDKSEAKREGFRVTYKSIGRYHRFIVPSYATDKFADLEVYFWKDGENNLFQEKHRMYLWDFGDIIDFAGNEFEFIEVKPTKTWMTWYKLRRK